jgi:hypothetical protein
MTASAFWIVWDEISPGYPPPHVLAIVAGKNSVQLGDARTASLTLPADAPDELDLYVLSDSYALLGQVVALNQTGKRRVWVRRVHTLDQVLDAWAYLVALRQNRPIELVHYEWAPVDGTIVPIEGTNNRAFRIRELASSVPVYPLVRAQWLEAVYAKHRVFLPPHEYAVLVAEDGAPPNEIIVAFDPPYSANGRPMRSIVNGQRTWHTDTLPWSGFTLELRPLYI